MHGDVARGSRVNSRRGNRRRASRRPADRDWSGGDGGAALRGSVAQPRAPPERDEKMSALPGAPHKFSPSTFRLASLLLCQAGCLLCFPAVAKGFSPRFASGPVTCVM